MALILALKERVCVVNGKLKSTRTVSECSQSTGPTSVDGMTCEPSRQPEIGASMLSAEAIHAKKTAMPGKALDLSSRHLVLSSSGLLTAFALELWFAKTRRMLGQTLLGLGIVFDPSWRDLVTLCCPLDCERVALWLTTSGTGCSCSPKLPTPCKRDYKGQSSKKWRERMPSESRKRADKPFATLPDAIGGSPHPEFVEAVLGFPIGFSDLRPLATPSSPKSPSGSADES